MPVTGFFDSIDNNMKKTLFTFALVTLIAPALQAATLFKFNTSQLDATTGDPLPTTVAIDYAAFFDEDEFGDPLPVPFFGVDTTAPLVTASNPLTAGYGNPIDGNALDALFSPVLFTFGVPLNISGFSATLDNSAFGTLPGFGTSIEFYDSAEALIASIAIDQTVPLFNATGTGTYSGVSKILFSSGAFYDNVGFVSVIPEPSSSVALGLIGVIGMTMFRRRG